jgi:hypothetical protein
MSDTKLQDEQKKKLDTISVISTAATSRRTSYDIEENIEDAQLNKSLFDLKNVLDKYDFKNTKLSNLLDLHLTNKPNINIIITKLVEYLKEYKIKNVKILGIKNMDRVNNLFYDAVISKITNLARSEGESSDKFEKLIVLLNKYFEYINQTGGNVEKKYLYKYLKYKNKYNILLNKL